MYIPSGSSQLIYLNYVDVFCNLFNIINININDKILIFGDFNLPQVVWTYDSDYSNVLLPLYIASDVSSNLLYSILGNGLQKSNNCYNYQNNLLDLLFSNCSDVVSVVPSKCSLSRIDLFHVPIDDICS